MLEEYFFNFIYNNNYYAILKYLMILFNIYYLSSFLFVDKFKNNNIIIKEDSIKVCICTLGKKENNYIIEFVEYYKKIGVDKIFLYDNNELKGENFDDILNNYINNKFVEIINYRGKKSPQFEIMENCYTKNNKLYNWLIFYDIDEFIHLYNYSNIKYFLNEKRFKQCNLIYLNCIRHTDNDLLYYDNRTLKERFPEIKWDSLMYTVKSIIKGNLTGLKITTTHWIDRNIIGCDFLGHYIKPTKKVKIVSNFNQSFYKLYYIDHYSFKSTEEYINKINKGDAVFGYNNKKKYHKINLYFKYNKVTKEKINFIENNTGLDLTKYKLKKSKKKIKIKV